MAKKNLEKIIGIATLLYGITGSLFEVLSVVGLVALSFIPQELLAVFNPPFAVISLLSGNSVSSLSVLDGLSVDASQTTSDLALIYILVPAIAIILGAALLAKER